MCENCDFYQPMSAEDGYCEKQGIIVNFNDNCNDENEYYEDDDDDDDDDEYCEEYYVPSKKTEGMREFTKILSNMICKSEWVEHDINDEDDPNHHQFGLVILSDEEVVTENVITIWNDTNNTFVAEMDILDLDLFDNRKYIKLLANNFDDAKAEAQELLKTTLNKILVSLNNIKK
jgi:hypothetical protein